MSKLTVCLLAVASCFAQNPTLSVDPQKDANGELTVQVKNLYIAPATAYALGWSYGKPGEGKFGYNTQYHDSASGPQEGKALDPNETVQVKMGKAQTNEPLGVRVLAAIFANGATSGDPAWINSLLERRKKVYHDLPVAIDILNQADPDAALKHFEEWRERNRAAAKTRMATAPDAATLDLEHLPVPVTPVNAVPDTLISLLREGQSKQRIIRLLQEWYVNLGQSKPSLQ